MYLGNNTELNSPDRADILVVKRRDKGESRRGVGSGNQMVMLLNKKKGL